MMIRLGRVTLLVLITMVLPGAFGAETSGRRVEQSLDGLWEVAEGSMEAMPTEFDHTVPVPGLVDMARPAFVEVGKLSEKREAFWYRRTFTVEGTIPEIAILRINKAKYGMKVWLNGRVVGEHLPCFTPAMLDVKPHLKGSGQENEIVIRVGANRESVPEGQPSGWDFEKYLYIPGIYDSVALILTGAPYIENVQIVPDLEKQAVRLYATVLNPTGKDRMNAVFRIREARSGRDIVSRRTTVSEIGDDDRYPLDAEFSMEGCRLWSPEDPFLYEVEIQTDADSIKERFGMRSFRFDRETGRAMLNGKPYIMRGTNVCVYRFFEDAERGDKPWRAEWVRRLHQQFKSMHWNSIRYCIGFPPDFWYDIADEEGFLIQDEFPIWLLSDAPEAPKAEKIIPEYTDWMRRRWNHPCVVIWDAQNESVTPETGKALQAVRHLDLSDRPWENGWAEPQSLKDCVESHPYLFSALFNPKWGRSDFQGLADVVNVSPVPRLRDAQKKLDVPTVINEYAWLWLNRDGTPTCLTANVYEKLLGPDSTEEQRRLLYGKYLAALTEFWRAGRKCAGVLHFCGLGYSRAGDKPRPEGGATSDHFVDLEKLTFDPYFERYVRDAFAPVGLMIDYWGQELAAGGQGEVKVVIINDLHEAWTGNVQLRLSRSGRTVMKMETQCQIDALGRGVVTFEQPIPSEPGDYVLTAALTAEGQGTVRSVRDARVVAAK